jgi:predicted HicB family RNase H-like nuclease
MKELITLLSVLVVIFTIAGCIISYFAFKIFIENNGTIDKNENGTSNDEFNIFNDEFNKFSFLFIVIFILFFAGFIVSLSNSIWLFIVPFIIGIIIIIINLKKPTFEKKAKHHIDFQLKDSSVKDISSSSIFLLLSKINKLMVNKYLDKTIKEELKEKKSFIKEMMKKIIIVGKIIEEHDTLITKSNIIYTDKEKENDFNNQEYKENKKLAEKILTSLKKYLETVKESLKKANKKIYSEKKTRLNKKLSKIHKNKIITEDVKELEKEIVEKKSDAKKG